MIVQTLRKSVTKADVVDLNVVSDLTEAVALTEKKIGDEVLLPDGRTYKKLTNTGTVNDWEPDVTKTRAYPNDAARLARTGFTPTAGETVRINGTGLQFAIIDPADNTQDESLGGPTSNRVKPQTYLTDAEAETSELYIRGDNIKFKNAAGDIQTVQT